jgi:ABC-type taurine transport system substrate-binding protein
MTLREVMITPFWCTFQIENSQLIPNKKRKLKLHNLEDLECMNASIHLIAPTHYLLLRKGLSKEDQYNVKN